MSTRLALLFAAFWLAFIGAEPTEADSMSENLNANEVLDIRLVNLNGKRVDKDCLTREVAKVVRQVRENRIIPYRVKVWKDHPLVVKSLKEPVVEVRLAGYPTIIIPLLYEGDRLFLHDEKKDSYVLYEIASDRPDFGSCIDRNRAK